MPCLQIFSGFTPDDDDGNDDTHRVIFERGESGKTGSDQLKQLERRTIGIHGIDSAHPSKTDL